MLAEANAKTETDYQKIKRGGFVVESIRRGVRYPDYMAWVDGDLAVWGAGPDRENAINEALLTAKSLYNWLTSNK